jgi:Ydr279p protein family (RNase H2 complex component) wHTH domain/Ydr279p protein triple barrel domain
MARTTRSSPRKASAAASKIKDSPAETPTLKPPPESTQNPPRLFVLPSETSPDARFVTLPHPKTNAKTRYFFDPERGIYEFVKLGGDKAKPRSLVLTRTGNATGKSAEKVEGKNEDADSIEHGYVGAKGSDLYVATPFDPLFFVLLTTRSETRFRTSSDLFENFFSDFEDPEDMQAQFEYILCHQPSRNSWEGRLGAVCDTLDVGDEKMYRLSQEKLRCVLLSKARGMVEYGLPASLEEKFVTRALEAPVLAVPTIPQESSTLSAASESKGDGDEGDDEMAALRAAESQSTVATSTTTSGDTGVSTPATSMSFTVEDVTLEKPATPVVDLLRLRTSLDYLATYIPDCVKPVWDTPTPIDFAPLYAHMKQLDDLRDSAASRSFSDFSRKRNFDADDERAEERAEKKRKKDEEDKRKKAGVSQAVRALGKVNTTGMKKMSDFFTKKPAVKK